jgi:ABC-2 type transport system permease protein
MTFVSSIIRYLRLYLFFLHLAFKRATYFKADFWFRVLMDIVFYLLQIFFFKVLYLHTSSLAGWDTDHAQVFVASFLVVNALVMALFVNGIYQVRDSVSKGKFDYFLLRPVSSLYLAICADISVASLVNLVVALSYLAWTLVHVNVSLSLGGIALHLLLLVNGGLLQALMMLGCCISCFWTGSLDGSMALYHSTKELYTRPVALFNKTMQIVLITLVPYGLVASIPTTLLFEGPSLALLLALIGTTLAYLSVLLYLWNKGTRAYHSASS